jgi:hypothetical protein
LSDHGDIDLVLKRSIDEGRTWGPLQLIHDEGSKTAGNPAPVVDASTGRIHLLFSIDVNNVRVMTSDDHGATWSEPKNIHSAVSDADWDWHVPGPVHGIQLQRGEHAGRLVIPSDHNDGETWGSHVIYSDDHGTTWQRGATFSTQLDAAVRTNENVAVELVDGRIYFNSRDHGAAPGTRSIAYSSDGGLTYDGPFVAEPNLTTPTVQNSAIRFWATDQGDAQNAIVYSSPGSATSRRDLTIRISYDESATWVKETVIDPGPAAYSDLVKLDDENLGVLYEAGENLYDEVLFSYFALEDLAPAPWNGVDGDVNQNGALGLLDVEAFVAAWRSPHNQTFFGGQDSYTHGDLNFDGRLDLHDAFILRSNLLEAGLQLPSSVAHLIVPEPQAFTVISHGVLLGAAALASRPPSGPRGRHVFQSTAAHLSPHPRQP